MPWAGKRNAVPRKLKIPASTLDFDGMLIHKLTAREKEGFVLVSGEWCAFHINDRFALLSGQNYTSIF